MQSKKSFFNKTIFAKNILRFWPLWTIVSIGGAIFPIALWFEKLNGRNSNFSSYSTAYFYYDILSYVVPFVSIIYALIVAMIVWNYLSVGKMTNMYHSLPVSRANLFVTSFLSGLAIMFIPYVIAGVLCTIVTVAIGGGNFYATMVLIAGIFAESVFFFALATLMAHITGHVLALPIFYIVINFLEVIIENVVEVVKEGFLFGVQYEYSGRFEALSPIVYIMRNVFVTVDYYGDDFDRPISKMQNMEALWFYLAAGVVMTVLSYVAYTKRKSERTGDVVVFAWLKPVIHILFSIIGALAGGLLLNAIVSGMDVYVRSTIRFSVCVIVAGCVSYMVGKMLIEKTIKVFSKKNTIGSIIFVACCVVFCLFLKLDIGGVEKRIPAFNDIEFVEVSTDAGWYTVYPEDYPKLVEKIMDFHKTIIENKDILIERDSASQYYFDDYEYSYFTVLYKLKSGEEVVRHYALYLKYDDERIPDSFESEYVELITDGDMNKMILHDSDEYEIESMYVNAWMTDKNNEYSSDYSSDVSDEDKMHQIYEGIVKDADEGNWVPYRGIARYTYTEDVFAEITISLYFEAQVPNFHGSGYVVNCDDVYVRVTPQMTNTLSALIETGILSEAQIDEITAGIVAYR